MIAFGFRRRGLASLIKQIDEKSGLAALALGGTDVGALIAEERRIEVLTQAIEHARRHNERPWMERCARRLAEIDRSAQGRLKLSSVLATLGDLREAEAHLAEIPEAKQTGGLYLGALAILRAKQGRTEEAIDCFAGLGGGIKGHYPAPIVLTTAEDMIQGCPLGDAMAFTSRLRELYPDHLLIRSLLVRCLTYDGNIEQARELAAVPAYDLARAHQYERRQMREATALIFSMAGWNNELFDFARDVLAEDPTHWAMYYQASEAATLGARREEYDEVVTSLPAEHARAPEAIATLCRWMIDKGRIDEAKALIKDLRGRSASSFLNATLYLAISHGTAEDVKSAFDDCMRCGISPLGSVLSYCMHLYYFSDERVGLERAVDLLAQHRSAAENNATFWQLYLRCLVAAERGDDARALYGRLPIGLQRAAKLQPFAMYFNVRDGKDGEATKAWTGFVRRSKHVCVNGRTSYPETVSLRYSDNPGAVLLFANVFNGKPYLDWFLNHYRALGVDHFFVTDNDSDDGTVDRLSREPDVSIFTCSDSFASSAFGIVWTNHQLQRFGVGHWCFHVDIDEGFVFPGHDRGRSLKDLLAYLDCHAYGAVVATEVDMYPENLDGPAAGLFTAHRYFDTDYRSIRSEIPPYVLIRGGVRRRMTGLTQTMTKAPLIRMSSDFRYIECNHYTTHLPVADVTGALLHYKFVGDIAGRLNEAIDRGVHFGGALAYRRLRSAAEERGWEASLLSDSSRTFEGARSLEAAGILQTSGAWESFATQSP
jgi:hypothetical protein